MALNWTRSRASLGRSPVMRKPLGGLRARPRLASVGILLAVLWLRCGIAAAQPEDETPVTCPGSVKLTPLEVVRLAIPEYEKKLALSRRKLADKNDEWAWWSTYRAWLTECRESDLKVKGRRFLVVTIHETETPCEDCHWVVLGIVDLDHGKRVQSVRMRGRLDTLTEAAASSLDAAAGNTLVLRTTVGNGFNGALLEERVRLIDGEKATFRLEASEPHTVESWAN